MVLALAVAVDLAVSRVVWLTRVLAVVGSAERGGSSQQ